MIDRDVFRSTSLEFSQFTKRKHLIKNACSSITRWSSDSMKNMNEEERSAKEKYVYHLQTYVANQKREQRVVVTDIYEIVLY